MNRKPTIMEFVNINLIFLAWEAECLFNRVSVTISLVSFFGCCSIELSCQISLKFSPSSRADLKSVVVKDIESPDSFSPTG